jgi:hypothetical protein
MSNFRRGWGDSRSNEGKVFSVLTTWKSFALVPHFTGGVKTRLRSVDVELYEGILFADQDSKFAQQD